MKDLSPQSVSIDCLLDIESSGLFESSYPIEIAWYKPNINLHDSFLIMPDPTWVDWDDLAEELYHGIPRAQLFEEGISPLAAATRLNQALTGLSVTVDGFDWDSFWLKRLYHAANLECEFQLISLNPPLPEYHRPHRALADVMATFDAWKRQHVTN